MAVLVLDDLDLDQAGLTQKRLCSLGHGSTGPPPVSLVLLPSPTSSLHKRA